MTLEELRLDTFARIERVTDEALSLADDLANLRGEVKRAIACGFLEAALASPQYLPGLRREDDHAR